MNRTITTEAELDALPVGTVIAYLAPERPDDARPGIATRVDSDSWGFVGSEDPYRSVDIFERSAHITVLHVPGQPAPTVRPSRDDAIEAVSAALHITTDRVSGLNPGPVLTADGASVDVAVDAVLALLPGRTEAEVKAEALREAAEEAHRIDPHWDSALCIDGIYHPIPDWLRARADEVKRADVDA